MLRIAAEWVAVGKYFLAALLGGRQRRKRIGEGAIETGSLETEGCVLFQNGVMKL